jgi:hypothetical protein
VGSQGEEGGGVETSMAQVTGDRNGKGEAMGAIVFEWEEGEEARRLQGVVGGKHSEEQRLMSRGQK